jgi:hypothetical protein
MQIWFAGILRSLLLGLLGFSCAIHLSAQINASDGGAATSQAASSETAAVRGQVADPSGALIPGVKITVTTNAGEDVASVVSDAAGSFLIRGLKPGGYTIRATFDGFVPFQSSITLAANQPKRMNIVMAIEVAEQKVVVSDEAAEVNLDAGGNTSAVMLKGDDLGALSDDPDELASELSALAGPSAGPNGGEIFIDGFSGGELPPKSAILEIRVNQNPFSAEFDRLGYGRTEILTRPGTEKLHGQILLQGNDKSFNTGNPFTANIPEYHSYQFSGSLSGAISNKASFFLSVDSRDQQSVNAWRIPDAVLPNAAGVYVDNVDYAVSLLSPHIRDNASLRFDWQLGKRNTMTARYGFWYENEKGNLDSGPGTMASGSTHESNSDHAVQLSSTTIFNDHFINESRFQFERHNENHYADSAQRTIGVAGDFVGGGFTGQSLQDHRVNIEFQNLSTLSRGNHAIKFGVRLRDFRDANKSTAKFNGRFDFSPVTIGQTTYTASQVYARVANGLAGGQTFNSLVQQGFGPTSASYAIGNPSAVANVIDVALFAQDDVKVSPRLTLSGGLRWEAQNHIADHNDWAPRVSLAYALDGGKGKKTKTVVRAGYGFFYDRLGTQNLMTIQHASAQTQIVLNNPSCTSTATSLDAIDMTTCTSSAGAKNNVPVQYEIAPNYHASYTEQAGGSIERQLLPGTSVTLTYLHSFGLHQQVLRNANQAMGGTPQTNSQGYLYEYFPEAVFKQHQIIASFSTKARKNLALSGFYTYSTANSNGAGASGNNAVSNAYNLDQDYGRAGFVLRHVAFFTANYNAPWGLVFNPFVIAQSGRPFNITLATDPMNNLFNQRPTYAMSSTPLADQVMTPYGLLDGAALPGEQLVPVNLGSGPAAVAVNLRISRAFGFGSERAGVRHAGGDEGPIAPSSNTARPDRGGPGGGSLGPGGFGSGGGGATLAGPSVGAGRRYALRFSVQALNLFNNINYGTPVGVLGAPYFNRSTSLAGGAFSTGSAARRIFAQASLSF